jgi:hypothetical protein
MKGPPVTRRRFLRTAAVLGAGGGVALATPGGGFPGGDGGTLITPETDDTVGRGLALLSRSQSPDGSFSDGQFRSGNVGVTALAGLALMAGGHQPGRGAYGRVVSKAVDYCLAQAVNPAEPGYLANVAGPLSNSPMYQHGFGTLFLAEVLGMFPEAARQARVRDILEKAVQIIVKAQNRDRRNQPNLYGGWRYETRPGDSDVSVTVAMMMALRAARNAGLYVDKSVIDAGVEYITGCQDVDGGFVYKRGQRQGTGFARSAAAVVGLYSAGMYDGPVVERGLNYLMQFCPSRRGAARDVRPEYYYYGQYYAALAMWTAGGQFWAEWFPAIREELIVRSRTGAGGMWADERGSSFPAACSCIILQLPNNYLPILQK